MLSTHTIIVLIIIGYASSSSDDDDGMMVLLTPPSVSLYQWDTDLIGDNVNTRTKKISLIALEEVFQQYI